SPRYPHAPVPRRRIRELCGCSGEMATSPRSARRGPPLLRGKYVSRASAVRESGSSSIRRSSRSAECGRRKASARTRHHCHTSKERAPNRNGGPQGAALRSAAMLVLLPAAARTGRLSADLRSWRGLLFHWFPCHTEHREVREQGKESASHNVEEII